MDENSDSSRDVFIKLEEFKPFTHQVAGHKSAEESQGMLISQDGIILKPVQDYPRGEREIDFYENVFKKTHSDDDIVTLRKFLPQYYGTIKLSDEHRENNCFLKLEDVTKNFRFPCILDVKIGKISWDPFASDAKIKRQTSKSALQTKVGFRILGFKVFDRPSQSYKTYDKRYGKNISTEDELQNAFLKYLSGVSGGRKKAVLSAILSSLESIHQWFATQRTYMFRCSSLLIVYEGNIQQEDQRPSLDNDVIIKMIDFAHVFENRDCDTNYLDGLTNLIATLNSLHHIEGNTLL